MSEETRPTDRMVKFADVMEIVSGVAPPDSYYYKGDTTAINTWQAAISRVQVELERYLELEDDMDDVATDILEAAIDAWVEIEVGHNPAAIPDFWDECDTSGRLAEHLIQAGWRKP